MEEFDGLKVGNATPIVQTPPKTEKFSVSESGDEEFLQKVKKINYDLGEEVVYGVYNNSEKGVSVRINDFLIDHSSVKLKEKSYFFHMLAVMVDAGIPVVSAVKSLAKRAKNEKFRRVLNTTAYFTEKGSTLSDAMSRFEDVFDEAEIGVVQSGEATGRLHKMLFKLSDQLDRRHDLYLKLYSSAAYPIAVLAVLVLVAVGMLVFVFPTLLGLLTEGGLSTADLPLATRVLITLQAALTGYWWLMILGLFMVYGIFKFYVGTAYGALRWDLLKLKLPLVGGLLRRVFVLRFVSLLGILMEAGLPVISALKITSNSIANKIYRLKIQEVIAGVHNGEKISVNLRDSEFLFPAEIREMLAVGEASASISKVAEKISEQYQKEIDNSLKKLTSVFEPLMILFVGLFVGLLALAIMAPIFNLSSSIS